MDKDQTLRGALKDEDVHPWLYRDGLTKQPYLFTVKGCREGCCFGIHIMLGELLLGLPNPELLMLFVLLGIPMP